MSSFLVNVPISLIVLFPGSETNRQAIPPSKVEVLPVFFVPKGEAAPKPDQTKRLMRHLEWTKTRYKEMLRNRETFAVAEGEPYVYRSSRPLAFYRQQPEGSAPQVASELLDDLKFTRFSCPYILLTVMMNPKDDFPGGGGRPLNGGLDTGGGIIVFSSFALDQAPNFQSTLQHELGHAFGLPHVDVYGFDKKSNDSIMSYNPRHHTKGFVASKTPGKLNPEDVRGLSLNQRAFPKLRFEPSKDVPRGYKLSERIVTLGPMQIPSHPEVIVTTPSGEDYSSKVGQIVLGPILPSDKNSKVVFDRNTMWHSAKTSTGWVSVQIKFPYVAELTSIKIHSQHSGNAHAAEAVRIAVRESGAGFRPVIATKLRSVDATVSFPKTTGQEWQLELQAGHTQYVVLRGLRFFSGKDELFPPSRGGV
jgi:hypothetical protein